MVPGYKHAHKPQPADEPYVASPQTLQQALEEGCRLAIQNLVKRGLVLGDKLANPKACVAGDGKVYIKFVETPVSPWFSNKKEPVWTETKAAYTAVETTVYYELTQKDGKIGLTPAGEVKCLKSGRAEDSENYEKQVRDFEALNKISTGRSYDIYFALKEEHVSNMVGYDRNLTSKRYEDVRGMEVVQGNEYNPLKCTIFYAVPLAAGTAAEERN